MNKPAFVAAVIFAAIQAAGANSIDYPTGTFVSGKLTGSFTTSISASITGSVDTIDISTGTLVENMSGCPTGATCYDFTGGSVTVSQGSTTIFTDSLSGGITLKGTGVASIQAVLTDKNGLTAGAAVASFDFEGRKITSGSEDVNFNRTVVTPEPSMLLLVGTGLVPLGLKLRARRAQLGSRREC